MTMNRLEGLIKNDKDRIPVEFLEGFSTLGNGDKVVTTLLAWLQSFKTLLLTARHKLGIEPTLGLQFTLFENYRLQEMAMGNVEPPLSPEQLSVLNKETQEILDYFDLTPNLWGTVRMAVLVNVLYLPPKSETVSLTKPRKSAKMTALYVTELISISELKREIGRLKAELDRELANLPMSRLQKIDEETVKWGQAMWLARKQTNVFTTDKPFRVMRTRLAEMLEDDSVPSPTELRKYYERFLNYELQLQSAVKPEP